MGLTFIPMAAQQYWRYFEGLDWDWVFSAIISPLTVITAAEALQIKNWRWTWFLWPVYVFVLLFGWGPSMAFVRTWGTDVSQVALAVFIVQAFRENKGKLRLVAIAYTLYVLVRCTVSNELRPLIPFPHYLEIGGWRWFLTTPTNVSFGIVTLVVYVRELILDRREKQRLAAELEAAREVQHVLIPEEIPTVPGFAIQSVYKPAGEVGGDFFQILPTDDGGVLAVIGDVSGKGMPAAMTVSLLVGTVRTLAHYTQSPGEILAALNQRMLTRSQGGFTTCLVLRADAGGKVTMANAGHLAPYLNGSEAKLESGLPLGLTAKATYAETSFRLDPEAQVTLLTDGVVEARAKTGELLGFDKTAAMSRQSAESIASAAKSFGQVDDITVVTLRRAAQLGAHAAQILTESPIPARNPS